MRHGPALRRSLMRFDIQVTELCLILTSCLQLFQRMFAPAPQRCSVAEVHLWLQGPLLLSEAVVVADGSPSVFSTSVAVPY